VTAFDKASLRAELLRVLEAELATMERAERAAREGATHEEAKPENDKDTRALEASYLARGQSLRAEELRAHVTLVKNMALRAFAEDDPIALGAVVTLEEAEHRFVVFVAPCGGGTKLAAGAVQVVTPRSPLCDALMGRQLGDECEVLLAGRIREIAVVSVT
jgi:transcription elongation GreA/GreB family factor